ncbi:MAG: nitroreductase family protein, partial [Candidatus Bathyarchaeota archaeon]
MSCIEKILSRRSVRKFTNTPVTEQILNNILEAGRLAPSATNNQPWHFVVVKDSKGKDACDFQGFNRWVNGASFVIVGFYRSSEMIIDFTIINLLKMRLFFENLFYSLG